MLKLRLSFRYCAKVYVYISCLVIFYIEFVTYGLLSFQWIKLPDCKPPKCSKLMLIADPQIIGSHIDGHNIRNFFEKWDSDRYMRKTFLQALDYIGPHIIIFLGDLMDEGHISSDEEFFYDIKRFLLLFKLPGWVKEIPKIYLPGDNDIGGVDDIMIPKIVHRFKKVFNQSQGPITYQMLEFYKVNFMTYEIEEPNYIDTANIDASIRVALSHVPLLPSPSSFFKAVIKKIRPHVIFSGHTHASSHFITSESDIWKRKYNSILPEDIEGKTYNLRTGLIHEIVVPTCSYRMGVKNMGYGAAFIDTENKLLHYNVLWLPRRFIQLSVYLALVLIPVLLIFFATLGSTMKIFKRLILRFCGRKITSGYFSLV